MKYLVGFFWVLIVVGFVIYFRVTGKLISDVFVVTIPSLIAAASLTWVVISHESQREWRSAEQEKANSETYSKDAILSIERAYNVISNNGTRDGPMKDRLEWLTCARWLAVSKRLAAKITDQAVQEIYEDEQEFWRIQFYNFFKPSDLHGFASDINNFEESRRGVGDQLEPKSVTIIYKFIEWPDDRSDPIDEHLEYSEEEVSNLSVIKRGMREYLGGEP